MSNSPSCATSPSQHSYVPPVIGDSRSPCPALNALANHGYLPRDGQNITVFQMVRAMRYVYHISLPLALLLAVVGVFKCGNWWRWTVDLHDLARHNIIEHSGSLVHADAPPHDTFAPTTVDQSMLQQVLHITRNHFLTLRDLARVRAMRNAALSVPLDTLHAEISRGEVVLTLDTLGVASPRNVPDRKDSDYADSNLPTVPKEYVSEWFGQERLPDGWSRPKTAIGLISVVLQSRKVSGMVAALQTTMYRAPHRD
ncbi:Cloroperoxidase [Amylocystis lapponica]|nr:Cloroperoxidase [Amylocystis lapponica]